MPPESLSPSPCVARLQPSGLSFTVQPGQSLLEAALAAGIHMARSCRNGTCRACMCQLASGQVRYRIAWPGLSADEKDEGWILPCVALPQGDVVLVAPSARRLGGDGGA